MEDRKTEITPFPWEIDEGVPAKGGTFFTRGKAMRKEGKGNHTEGSGEYFQKTCPRREVLRREKNTGRREIKQREEKKDSWERSGEKALISSGKGQEGEPIAREIIRTHKTEGKGDKESICTLNEGISKKAVSK